MLNASHKNPANNHEYVLQFPASQTFTSQDTIRMESCNIIYSWANLTSAYNNNSFQYSIGASVFTVQFPQSSFMTISDMNGFLQSAMQANGTYLQLKSDQSLWFPVQLLVNPSLYSVEFVLIPFPQTLNSTLYTDPANFYSQFPGLPAATTPAITISNNFADIVGITRGTYGGGSNQVTVLSNYTPNVSPVQSLVLRCNLVYNPMTVSQSDVLFTTTPSQVSYGSNIFTQNMGQTALSCRSGTFQSIVVGIYDQSGSPVVLKDFNCTFLISITRH